MKFLKRLTRTWKSELSAVEARAADEPEIIQSEIGSLETILSQGEPDYQAKVASAIETAITEKPSIGLSEDVFQLILQNSTHELPSVRQPLVRSLGTVAPIVAGDMKRQLVASSHVLTELLEFDDEYTIKWALPAVGKAIQEYPDPFISYADAIATGINSDEGTIVTGAVESLATIAEEQYEAVQPHAADLFDLPEDTSAYQQGEAMRAVALVLSNAPDTIDRDSYTQKLESMYGQTEPVLARHAVRSVGYLLSSQPKHWEDAGLLSLVTESLQDQDDHIQKEAAIAALRIIHNTDLPLLDDPEVVRKLNYAINEYELEDELTGVEDVAEDIRVRLGELGPQ